MLLGVSESPFFTSELKSPIAVFGDSERGLPTAIINTGSQIANAIAPAHSDRAVADLRLARHVCGERRNGASPAAGVVEVLSRSQCPGRCAAACRTTQRRSAAREGQGALACAVPTQHHMVYGDRQLLHYVHDLGLSDLAAGYLEKSLGFSLKATGWIASIPFLAGILGVLVGGMLFRQPGARGVRAITARKVPIVSGAALAACFVAPIPFGKQHPGWPLACWRWVISSRRCRRGALLTLASDIAPKSQCGLAGRYSELCRFPGGGNGTDRYRHYSGYHRKFTNVFLLGAALLMLGALSYGLFVRKPLQAG